MVWRETEFGPRAALLSSALQPTLILAPEQDFPCRMEASIGAQVDADGTLHLVAAVQDNSLTGGGEVRYWEIDLP